MISLMPFILYSLELKRVEARRRRYNFGMGKLYRTVRVLSLVSFVVGFSVYLTGTIYCDAWFWKSWKVLFPTLFNDVKISLKQGQHNTCPLILAIHLRLRRTWESTQNQAVFCKCNGQYSLQIYSVMLSSESRKWKMSIAEGKLAEFLISDYCGQ